MHSNKGGITDNAPQSHRGRPAPSPSTNAQVTNPPLQQERTGNQRPTKPQGRDKDAAKGRKAGQERARKQKLTDDDFDCDDVEEHEEADADLAQSIASVESLQEANGHPGGEIRMSDLPMKIQKQKGDDYVMISDINKVIALEDSVSQLDGPGVDGWEYIQRGEQRDLVVSYAQAVATPLDNFSSA